MSIYWMNKKPPEWTEGISKQLVLIGDKPVLLLFGISFGDPSGECGELEVEVFGHTHSEWR